MGKSQKGRKMVAYTHSFLQNMFFFCIFLFTNTYKNKTLKHKYKLKKLSTNLPLSVP